MGVLAQFSSNPSTNHWSGVKRIFRYLKGTLNYGLVFIGSDFKLPGYCDADWGGDLNTRRSTSGYIFTIGDSMVTWTSKKQLTVAKSSTEAEYVALSLATQEAIWIRQLLKDVGMFIGLPTIIYEDNNSAIELSKNSKFHNRTKHIDISHHFIRERVISKEIEIKYCSSSNNLADIMTKALPTT